MEFARLRAVPAMGLALAIGGNTDRAAQLAYDFLDAALRRADDAPIALYWVGSVLINALVIGGRLAEADDIIAFGRGAFARWSNNGQEGTYLSFAEGMTAVMRGQAERAQRLLRDASLVALAPAMPAAAAFAVEAHAMTSDLDCAETAAEAAEHAIARTPAFEGVLRRARAWLCVARGQLNQAADAAIDAAQWSRTHHQYAAEAFALHDAVRLGRARTVAARLSQLANDTEMRWAPIFADHAVAASRDDGDRLDAAASSFEELGSLLRAAESAAQGAAAHRRAGQTQRAARSTARAQTLLALCDGAHPTAARINAPVPLTGREQEVANLAAAGLTSNAIGARLFLSPRTVEGHLMRAYQKLGVNDRAGLARLIDAM